jgi:hypothetical protein
MFTKSLADSFPANNPTDGKYLYRSLGSFWTRLFTGKNALKGYTIGMAEELIQSYINLNEVIGSYSIKHTPILHKENWFPLVIKKSEFNKSPFAFKASDAVFGEQPETSSYFANAIFKFGQPKETSNNVYSFSLKNNIKSFGLIANKLIDPTALFLPGVDLIIEDSVVYINNNLFDNTFILKSKLLGELGEIATYKDANGDTQEEEFIILWLYGANIDNYELYNTFGTLIDINLPSSQSYKKLLEGVLNLAVEGPTVKALTVALASLINIPITTESEETVEDIHDDEYYKYIVTDKSVYNINKDRSLNPEVAVGMQLHSGTILTSELQLIDPLIANAWWNNEVKTDKLAFASHIFAANTNRQLFFETSLALITYTDGKIIFPVTGDNADVQSFQNYINLPENKTQLLQKLGLSEEMPALPIVPVDFVFNNFFKNNTLFIKLNFYSAAQISAFVKLLPLIRPYLPPHVYILFYMTLNNPQEEWANLNYNLTIKDFPNQTFCADGSTISGKRPQKTGGDENYYKDYVNRLFCVAINPVKDNLPLHDDTHLVHLAVDNSSVASSAPGVKAGNLRTEIPSSFTPPGESAARRPSTKEIPSILLIDF